MEQYLSLIWKNYTASNTDQQFSDEDDDSIDLFADNDLHYKIPFWIGVIVISLLLLSAIIGAIRYCIHTLCSSNNETETMALMPPKSPCISTKPIRRNLSDKNETSSSSSSEQFREHHSNISVVPIIRQNSSKHYPSKLNKDDIENHYFSPNDEFQTPVDFRKKIHDIYILPVSPALSSSSSSSATTNTEENMRINSNTMPNQSRKHIHQHGIKNDCFTDSPQPKNRTLPRLHTNTIRRMQPPSQSPPLPPINPQFQQQLSVTELDPNGILIQYHSNENNQIKKTYPPPVPCRSQKPSILPIGFDEITKQTNKIGFQLITESSPQSDYSEHTWPNPPESMSTSQVSRRLSIPYDHLMPTVIMHQNNPIQFFHQYRHNEHSMLTESDT